jgi:hypothetical protein
MSVTIPFVMKDEEFWSEVLGSTEFTNEWWLRVKYLDGASWDKPGLVQLTIGDGEGNDLTRTLSLADIVEAYKAVVEQGYHHCGSKIDIFNMDECASDIVLQQAMFGDVIYS